VGKKRKLGRKAESDIRKILIRFERGAKKKEKSRYESL